eukprot:Gb_25528 [translate_table: standard]
MWQPDKVSEKQTQQNAKARGHLCPMPTIGKVEYSWHQPRKQLTKRKMLFVVIHVFELLVKESEIVLRSSNVLQYNPSSPGTSVIFILTLLCAHSSLHRVFAIVCIIITLDELELEVDDDLDLLDNLDDHINFLDDSEDCDIVDTLERELAEIYQNEVLSKLSIAPLSTPPQAELRKKDTLEDTATSIPNDLSHPTWKDGIGS